MKTIITKTLLIIVGSVSLFTVSAFAASQGSVAATSSGSSDLSVTTTAMIQITDVGDLTDAGYDGTTDPLELNDDVCIWTNDTGLVYNVEGEGDGAANAFTIENAGATETIAYTVKWSDSTTTGGDQITLTADSAHATDQDVANDTYPCPGNNANFEVEFTRANLLSVPADTYTGTLTLIVTPAT